MSNDNSLMIVRKYNIYGKNYFIGELIVKDKESNFNIIEDRYILDLENENMNDLSLISFHLNDIFLESNNNIKLLDENVYKEHMKNNPFEFCLNNEFKISLKSYKILISNSDKNDILSKKTLNNILSISNLKDEEYERYADINPSYSEDIVVDNMSPLSEEELNFIKDFARQPKENNILLYINKDKPEELEILDYKGKAVYCADNLEMNVFGWDDKNAYEDFIKEYDDVITENNKLYCLELFIYNAEDGFENGDFYVFDENNKIFNYEEYKNYNEDLEVQNKV